MKDVTREQRWWVWMHQARRFAAREQYTDAVARARLVRDDMASALRDATDPERYERLEQYLRRVDKELENLKAKRDAWQGQIAQTRQQAIAHMDEQVNEPLPEGLPK